MSFWRVISEAQSLRTEFLRTKDCQSSRKSYKTYVFVGWVVGWKKPANSRIAPRISQNVSRCKGGLKVLHLSVANSRDPGSFRLGGCKEG